MKKLFALIALLGVISLGATGPAAAKCYGWKKVCKPVFKHKVVWATCHDGYGYAYKCKKKRKVKVGHKCHNKCVSWKPKHSYKKKYYKKKHYDSY